MSYKWARYLFLIALVALGIFTQLLPQGVPTSPKRRETAGKSKALNGPSCLRASQIGTLQPGERNAPTKNVDAPTPLKINQHCKWDIMEVWKFIFLSFHG